METTLHPFFETLGLGPYRFLYCYDLGEAMNPNSAANFGNMRGWAKDAPKLKAGLGTCAHCGMGISIICVVQTGDGSLYGVGSDCVEKCDHEGAFRGAKAAIALRRKRKAQAAREAKRKAKWEAERPERERKQAELLARWKEEYDQKHAAILARFDQFEGILNWLVGSLAAQWREQYQQKQRGVCGEIDAMFSPPCDLSSFHQSLAIQLIQRGTLSPRQAECVARNMYGRAQKHAAARDALITTLTA